MRLHRTLLHERVLIYAIILLGAALRFYQLGHFSLWDGEIFTLFISQKPLPLILPALRDFGAHPPLWFLITRAFDAFGWNEWMLRAPSALVGILAIPALYVAGKRAENATVGLLAALLLACAPLAVLYAQVGRMYSVIIPLAALMLYAATRALQQNRWRWWLALSVFSALIVYNQYLSLIAVGSAYLMAGLVLVAQTWHAARNNVLSNPSSHAGVKLADGNLPNANLRESKPISAKNFWEFVARSSRQFAQIRVLHPITQSAHWKLPSARTFVREFFRCTAHLWASFGAFLVLLAPLLPLMQKNFFQRQIGREATTVFEPITVNADFLRALFLDLAGSEWLFVISGLLILAGLVLSLRKRDYRPLLLFVTWFGLVFVVVTLIHPRRFPSRYVLHLVPVYILLTAHGIFWTGEGLGKLIARANPTRGARVFIGAATAALLVLAALEVSGMYRGAQEISRGERTTALLLNGGWRELARYLDEQVAPGDMVVYAGEGALRPPRFIAPYVSAEYQTRAHRIDAPNQPTSQPTSVWWVGVNLDAQDIVNPAPTQVTPLRAFGDTRVARATRAVEWTPIALPPLPGGWKTQAPKFGIRFGSAPAASDAPSLRAEFSAPVNAQLIGPTIPVQPGQLFRVRARVRGVSEGLYEFSPGFELQFSDANNKEIIHSGAQTLLAPDADGWQTLVLDGVVPPNATRARLALDFSEYSFSYAPLVELEDLRWQMEQIAAVVK